MPLFKFSNIDADIVLAQVYAVAPFTEVLCDSSVVGLTAVIEAEIVFTDALLFETAKLYCKIPFWEIAVGVQNSATVVCGLPPLLAEFIATVSVDSEILANIPGVTALILQSNYIETFIPKYLVSISSTSFLTADAIAVIPNLTCRALVASQDFVDIVAEFPGMLSSLTCNAVIVSVSIIAEIPFITAIIYDTSQGSFSHGTEEDVILRHSYSRRYI